MTSSGESRLTGKQGCSITGPGGGERRDAGCVY